MAPTKRKRVSKKNKKSWRRNVDLKDVDNFLEDKRLEERLGFKYAERKDDDLFQIDTKGADESVVQSNVKESGQKENLFANRKGVSVSLRLRETETPKCYEALVKRSAVPPAIVTKSGVNEPKKPKKISKRILKRNLRKDAFREIQRNTMKNKKQQKRGEFTYDVWSKENNDRDLNGCSDWLSNDAVRHTLHNTGKLTKQIPKTILSKPSLLPAVEAPHPGLSYNPSLKDHTDILKKVAEDELQVMDEEKHLNRVTTKMFNKVPQNELQKEWLSEMTVGLSMVKSDTDDDEDGNYKSVNPPVKNKKKTLKKRRKLKEALLLKEKLKQQKIEKRKLSDIYKLRKFNEILTKKEEKTLKRMEKRKKIQEQKPYTTKTLSQTKYVEPEVDFALAEELPGNLRSVKPEGNLLLDRYKSLQKRNILQPSLKRHVKKRKVKKYERAHTKMDWEKNELQHLGKNKTLK